MSLMAGHARGRKYTTNTPVKAVRSPVSYGRCQLLLFFNALHLWMDGWMGDVYLFEPGMEIRSGHEQHPPTQPRHGQWCPNASLQRSLLLLPISLPYNLPLRLPHTPIPPRHPPLLPQPLRPNQRRQHLEPQKQTPQHQNENMPTDIVPAPPLAPHSLTSLPRHKLLRPSRPLHRARQLARAPRDPEPPIHEPRSEKPLRHRAPPQRHETPPQRPPQPLRRQHQRPTRTPHRRRPRRRVQRQKEEERDRDPEPGDLDEEDVEDVALAREVVGRLGRRVGLRDGVVGRGAGGGVEGGEEGAEEEGGGVGEEDEGFEGGGEEGV